MSGYAKYARQIEKEDQAGRPPWLWAGHSTFEFPEFVAEYAGQPEVHVLLHLYRRARGKSYKSMTATDLTLPVRVDKLALKTGLSTRSVERAFARLESDHRISRVRPTSRGRFLASRITLLDGTGQPLQTSPRQFRVCRENDLTPFVTMPRVSLEAINTMTLASEKAVYIAAHVLASREKRESVHVDKVEWLILSGLAENAFNRGVKQCKAKKILSYGSGVLTILDPLTGKANARWKNRKERIEHDNPHWAFDLNDITAEEWHFVVESLLSRKLETGPDGWTLHTVCPFCTYKEKFHVNFSKSAYKCHECDASGRLGQLVMRVRNVNMDAAKEYIKQHQAELQRMRIEV
jgi:CHC2 zinc finger